MIQNATDRIEDLCVRLGISLAMIALPIVLLALAAMAFRLVFDSSESVPASDGLPIGKLDGERAVLVAVKVYRVGDGLSSTNVHGSAGDWLILAVPADTNDARRCISDIGNDKLIFTHGACNAVQSLSTMNLLLSGVK